MTNVRRNRGPSTDVAPIEHAAADEPGERPRFVPRSSGQRLRGVAALVQLNFSAYKMSSCSLRARAAVETDEAPRLLRDLTASTRAHADHLRQDPQQ